MNRQACWEGTLDWLSNLTVRIIGLLPSLTPTQLQKVHKELRDLQFSLQQVRAKLETVVGSVEAVQGRYDFSKDQVEDAFRRQLTFTACKDTSVVSLRDAILDAYPYHYFVQPLKTIHNRSDNLQHSFMRSAEAVKAVLDEADRMTRQSLEVWTRRLTLYFTLGVLVIAIPQFLTPAQLNERTYPGELAKWISIDQLSQDTIFVISIALTFLILSLLAYIGSCIYNRFPKMQWIPLSLRQTFIEGTQNFEFLVDRANEFLVDRAKSPDKYDYSLAELESLDQEATDPLVKLWNFREGKQDQQIKLARGINRIKVLCGSLWYWISKQFTTLCRGRATTSRYSLNTEVKNWLRSARELHYLIYLCYLIYLFDLAPNIIPLPRALCIYRCRSTDFLSGAVITDSDFEESLRWAGFDIEECRQLKSWLDDMAVRDDSKKMDIVSFVTALKERGVSADPDLRTPDLWHGKLSQAQQNAGTASGAAA